MGWIELAVALLIVLAGSEMFTNGVEWAGEQHGLSEGAVGSVLAAVGTALPETVLPLVAILFGTGQGSARGTGAEVGTGAILGAPFMLNTLAMFVLGTAVLIFARGGRRSKDLTGDGAVIARDLGCFLVMYALGVLAGLVHFKPMHYVLAAGLITAYVFYVRRHFSGAADREDIEATGEVKPLYLWGWLHRAPWTKLSPKIWTYAQVLISLILIVGGAELFVRGIDSVSRRLGVPPLVFALLIAPLATELPEKFNSVIWLRRRKDTLALGNMTGAMVFQSVFPVSVGLIFTDWKLLPPGHPEGLVSACLALIAGSILWLTIKRRGSYKAWVLLFQGAFWAGYVAYVLAVVVPNSKA